MPFKAISIPEQREAFVRRVLAKEASKTELLKEYHISRTTGDKWIKRYLAGEPLTDRRMRPEEP